MSSDILTIVLAFAEGFSLILSPCILSILPLILAGSLIGNKKRPFAIILGFILTFTLTVFFSRQLVLYLGVDLNLIRSLSFGILILLGVILFSTTLSNKFAQLTQGLSSLSTSFVPKNQNNTGSALLFGALCALIWTPCAGPILATVIVQTATQTSSFYNFLSLFAFAVGAALPMLVITLYGRNAMNHFQFFKQYTTTWRKILGALIMLSTLFMLYSERIPNFNLFTNQNRHFSAGLKDGLLVPYPAPSIAGISSWLNSKPLDLQDLRGKVVLVDFWTYSCINCIRTLPYLRHWSSEFSSQDFIILGIHTPEFEFEKDLNNVQQAIEKNHISYPIALDNQYITWRNFKNRYWPAHYLIDAQGNVVYIHYGEGDYDVMEHNIRYLLGKPDISYTQTTTLKSASLLNTPETYLGYERAVTFSSPEPIVQDKVGSYTFPTSLRPHQWALQGNWRILPDKIISAGSNATIQLSFYAKNVYIVMGNSTKQAISVDILLNGKPIQTQAGTDTQHSKVIVDQHTLYHIVNFQHAGYGTLQLKAGAGLEIYTFTFGE